MQIVGIGLHQLHSIQRQHGGEELRQGSLGIRHRPLGKGAVGRALAGRQTIGPHPEIGGNGARQMQKRSLRWQGGQEQQAGQQEKG